MKNFFRLISASLKKLNIWAKTGIGVTIIGGIIVGIVIMIFDKNIPQKSPKPNTPPTITNEVISQPVAPANSESSNFEKGESDITLDEDQVMSISLPLNLYVSRTYDDFEYDREYGEVVRKDNISVTDTHTQELFTVSGVSNLYAQVNDMTIANNAFTSNKYISFSCFVRNNEEYPLHVTSVDLAITEFNEINTVHGFYSVDTGMGYAPPLSFFSILLPEISNVSCKLFDFERYQNDLFNDENIYYKDKEMDINQYTLDGIIEIEPYSTDFFVTYIYVPYEGIYDVSFQIESQIGDKKFTTSSETQDIIVIDENRFDELCTIWK